MNPPYWFVLDVESIGLHGVAFACGIVVVDAQGAVVEEIRECCALCNIRSYHAHPLADREWVRANVPDMEPTVGSEAQLLEAFWGHWTRWRGKGAWMAADCAWPVEARFLARCVDLFPASWGWSGPYPLVDVGSVLGGTGVDPRSTFERIEGELPRHDPLRDARQSARVLIWALQTRDWMKRAATLGIDSAGAPPSGVILAKGGE